MQYNLQRYIASVRSVLERESSTPTYAYKLAMFVFLYREFLVGVDFKEFGTLFEDFAHDEECKAVSSMLYDIFKLEEFDIFLDCMHACILSGTYGDGLPLSPEQLESLCFSHVCLMTLRSNVFSVYSKQQTADMFEEVYLGNTTEENHDIQQKMRHAVHQFMVIEGTVDIASLNSWKKQGFCLSYHIVQILQSTCAVVLGVMCLYFLWHATLVQHLPIITIGVTLLFGLFTVAQFGKSQYQYLRAEYDFIKHACSSGELEHCIAQGKKAIVEWSSYSDMLSESEDEEPLLR